LVDPVFKDFAGFCRVERYFFGECEEFFFDVELFEVVFGHFDEFDWGFAAFANRGAVCNVFLFGKESFGFEFEGYFFACFFDFKAKEESCVFVHFAVLVDGDDGFEFQFSEELDVVDVSCRAHHDKSAAFFHACKRVGLDGNFLVINGGDCVFSFEVLVAFVVGVVDDHGAGADEFGSCCSDNDFFASFLNFPFHVVECAGEFVVFDFGICDGGLEFWVPVVDAFVFVDGSFFVK